VQGPCEISKARYAERQRPRLRGRARVATTRCEPLRRSRQHRSGPCVGRIVIDDVEQVSPRLRGASKVVRPGPDGRALRGIYPRRRVGGPRKGPGDGSAPSCPRAFIAAAMAAGLRRARAGPIPRRIRFSPLPDASPRKEEASRGGPQVVAVQVLTGPRNPCSSRRDDCSSSGVCPKGGRRGDLRKGSEAGGPVWRQIDVAGEAHLPTRPAAHPRPPRRARSWPVGHVTYTRAGRRGRALAGAGAGDVDSRIVGAADADGGGRGSPSCRRCDLVRALRSTGARVQPPHESGIGVVALGTASS